MRKFSTLFCFYLIFVFITPSVFGQTGGRVPTPPPGPGGRSPAGPGGQDFFGSAMADMEKAFESSEPTPEDAYYLGRAVAANILVSYKPYKAKPELTHYLNQILQALVINSSQPVAFKGYSVVILDTPEFNAFASPGGHILITRGLVEAATSEDMLAAVIAHELAHIILKHGLSLIDDMSLASEATSLANRAADFSGNSAAAKKLMSFRNSVSGIVDTMMKSGYAKPQEFAADAEAVAILAASGYNPQAMADVLKVLQRVQGSQGGGFNSTHPTPVERVTNIETVLRRYQAQDTGSYRAGRFKNK